MFMSTDEIQHKSIVNFPGGTVTPYLRRRRALKIVHLPEYVREHQNRLARKVAPIPSTMSKNIYKSFK